MSETAPRVALVVVGDEVLAGRVTDANGPWLAARLAAEGARVDGIVVAPDRIDAIEDAVRRAAATAPFVVVTGGLGPTDDDVTREGLAAAAGVPLVEDPAALALVDRAQHARGHALDARRRREARLPEGARALENPEGTAPGIAVRVGAAEVFALPGVPRELRAGFERVVLPALRATARLRRRESVALRATGVTEPDVAVLLEDVVLGPGLAVGFYPHEGELEVRFTATEGADPALLGEALLEARRRLGRRAWGDRPIEVEVVESLRARGMTATTAESITGGLVARMLTSVPGASLVFPGGWVTYSDRTKAAFLGVDPGTLREHGAVSDAVAREMAEGALERAGTDLAVSTTGIAGPGDGADPRGRRIPAGTWFVALARRGGPTESRGVTAPLSRAAVQRRAALLALDRLRRALLPGESGPEAGRPPAGPR